MDIAACISMLMTKGRSHVVLNSPIVHTMPTRNILETPEHVSWGHLSIKDRILFPKVSVIEGFHCSD